MEKIEKENNFEEEYIEDEVLENSEIESLLEENYFHYIENVKMEEFLREGFDKYRKIILSTLLEYRQEEINKDLLFKNILNYLSREHKNLVEERNVNSIKIAEKYSEYLTFIFIKNKFLLKKKFKNVLNDLNNELNLRDGGKLINIQFKDFNLLIYVHKE